MLRPTKWVLTAALLALLPLGNAAAQTVTFDFDTGSPALSSGNGVPLNQTSGGVLAGFSSPQGAAFSVQNPASLGYTLSQLSGKCLMSNNSNQNSLVITFGQWVTSVTVSFATLEYHDVGGLGSALQLNAYAGSAAGSPVGTVSANSSFIGESFPQGTLTYNSGGTPFNIVTLVMPPNGNGAFMFMVDNLTVDAIPRIATATAVPSANGWLGKTCTLGATLTRTSDGAGLGGATLTFKIGAYTLGAAVTNGAGHATLSYVMSELAGVGDKTLTVEFAGDTTYAPSSGTGIFSVSKGSTGLSFFWARGEIGKTVTLRCLLGAKSPVAGRSVAFAVDGTPAGSGMTDAQGMAQVAYTIPADLGTGLHNVTATFDASADSAYLGSTRTAAILTVLKAGTSFSLFGASGSPGGSVDLQCLAYGAGAPLVGKTIYASVDGVPVGSGVTDGTGIAIVTYAIPNGAAAGLHNVTFTFDGSTDPVFRGSTRTAAVLEVF